jgi:hypothetical protein
MLVEQSGCAICHTTEPGGKRDWHVDHDYETNEVRDILCHACNLTLGMVDDSIERLVALIIYLARHGKVIKGSTATDIKMLLGHKSIQNSERYMHPSQRAAWERRMRLELV